MRLPSLLGRGPSSDGRGWGGSRDNAAMQNAPLSYWHTSAKASGPALSHALPATADVVVIGGGIVGTCAAYWLARNSTQKLKVIQLDQHALAAGATGRNGGFLTLGTAESYSSAVAHFGKPTADAIWQLTLTNRDLMRGVIREEALPCDYREPGHLSLALSDESMTRMSLDAAARTAAGLEAIVLDRDQLRTFIRTDLGPDIRGAVYAPNTGLLHSAQFIYTLAGVAQRQGAELAQAQVTHLEPKGAGVNVHTSQGTILAGAVIVAANAWTSWLMPNHTSPIQPVRGQVLSYAAIPPVFQHGMGAGLTATGEYWQQTPTGEIVLGGCRAARPDGDVGQLNNDITDDVQAALERVLPTLFPKLAGLRVAQRWGGPMAFTPDYLPVADAVPDVPGAWFAGGFCGHGMPFGMIFGQLLAEAALSGHKPAALAPFALGRMTLREPSATHTVPAE